MKIDCNQCKKEIDLKSNVKNRIANGLSLRMIICPECKTVFPSGITNNNIKNRISKIRSFDAKREKIVAKADGKLTPEVVEKLDNLYKKQMEMVELNRQEGKQLLQKHYNLFAKFGKVYDPLASVVESLKGEQYDLGTNTMD